MEFRQHCVTAEQWVKPRGYFAVTLGYFLGLFGGSIRGYFRGYFFRRGYFAVTLRKTPIYAGSVWVRLPPLAPAKKSLNNPLWPIEYGVERIFLGRNKIAEIGQKRSKRVKTLPLIYDSFTVILDSRPFRSNSRSPSYIINQV